MIDSAGDWMLEVAHAFGIFFNLENAKKSSVPSEMTEVHAIAVNRVFSLLDFLLVCIDTDIFGVSEATVQLSRAQNWTQLQF